MRKTRILPMSLISFTLLMTVLLSMPIKSIAATPTIDLGNASSFAVLAGEQVTNTGTTTINGSAGGDIGVYPGTSLTGQSTLTFSGTAHLADAPAGSAKEALSAAYDDAGTRAPVTVIPAELGGKTLKPGVYNSDTGAFMITGTLTLDGEGNTASVFIFNTGSTLITAANSKVNLINGARVCNIFYRVGSSATLGTNSTFAGRIMASTSISAKTGATVYGQLLVKTGSVTLDSNKISNLVCTSAPTEDGGELPDTASNLSLLLVSSLFIVLIGAVGLLASRKNEAK